MQMEIILIIISLSGLWTFCLILIILHHKTSNSSHSYHYTKHLRCGYLASSIKFIKCINLCSKFCKVSKNSLSHDFECEGNCQKQISSFNSNTSNHSRIKIFQNPIDHETARVIPNYHLKSNLIHLTDVNFKQKHLKPSASSYKNYQLQSFLTVPSEKKISLNIGVYKTSDSSFSCSHLDEMLDSFDSMDDSSHLDSLLDGIPHHRVNMNTSRRLDYKNFHSKTLALKYKNYLSKIKQSSKFDRQELRLHLASETINLKSGEKSRPVHFNDANLESPWVKANNTVQGNLPISDQTSQSSCSSCKDEIQPSLCPKARDPINILADLYTPSHKVILDEIILQGTFSSLHQAKLLVTLRRNGVFSNKWKKVLVKTLTEKATTDQVRVFMTDACKFAGTKHSHLSTIIAASNNLIHDDSHINQQTISRPVIIYSNAKYGNLKIFLQRSKRIYDAKFSPNMILTATQLINMGLQILSAVDYLHSINLIHEDIATRNCV
ncbi:unnamed protein product, partial [Heterobilharzia americana]